MAQPELVDLSQLSLHCAVNAGLEQQGVSMSDLRRILGWSDAKLGQFFAGKYDPRYTEIVQIVKLLRIRPEELFK